VLKKVRKTKAKKNTYNLKKILTRSGLLLVALSLLGALVIFSPIIWKEISYFFNKPNKDIRIVLNTEIGDISDKKDVLVAADSDFSIVIPKISANSKIIPNVDHTNSREYQVALSKGVAHAKGTPYPDEDGNSFYFAHSSDNFYNANRYNSVFYLLNKLEEKDNFYIVYKDIIYKYEIIEKSIVSPEAMEYMKSKDGERIVTLMTCWPPGTTINRMVVVGKLIED
jgi:sortase A